MPIDRPVILKRLYQLFNCLLDRRVLTWSFFVTRFDLIINEVQNYDVHQKQLNESAMGFHKESEPVSETSNDKTTQQKIRHPTETVIPSMISSSSFQKSVSQYLNKILYFVLFHY